VDKYRDRYRISSTRLQKWDYGWDAAYFITICTAHMEWCFGKIIKGNMYLTNIGILADVFWHEIVNHSKNVRLGAFVVMPNHIHGILVLNGNNIERNRRSNTNVESPSGLSKISVKNSESTVNETVETTHALSQETSNSQKSIDITPDDTSNKVSQEFNTSQKPSLNESDETTHALSLQSPNAPKTLGQLRFQNQGSNTVSSVIGSYKSAVSKHAHRLGFEFDWQSRFDDRIIRDDQTFKTITNYILTNPKNWDKDRFNPENPNFGKWK
jgi:putative transposase